MLRLLALLALVAAATATPFTSCKVKHDPLAVDVPGCASLPCKFIRGKSISADIKIPIDHTVSKLTTKVVATALGVTTVFPLPEPNACNLITNSECPLSNGEVVNYALNMPVLSIYPKVRVDLEFTFTDQNGAVVSCFDISGQVVDA